MKRIGQSAALAAHLALMGIIGPIVLISLVTMVGTGIGMVPAFGTGLIILALVALGIWVVAWVEEKRAGGVLKLDLPDRRFPRSSRTDWLRIPHTLLLQFSNRQNLRTLAHLTIISFLGVATLALLQIISNGIFLTGTAIRDLNAGQYPIGWFQIEVSGGLAAALGILMALAGVGVIYTLTLIHRALSAQLLMPSREEELARQAQTATERRKDAVHSAEVERTRIERDLHDGVQPRLVSVGMTLGMAKAKLADDPEAAAALIDEAHSSTKEAITELRQLARGINPAVLSDRGLDAALSALAARSHIPVHLNIRLDQRCSKDTEAAMYFAIAESLTNATKHSGARECRVTVLERPGAMLWARVEDDGQGGARRIPGGGIDGVAGRIQAIGGSLTLSSPAGGPTTVEVSVPCGS
ncbi:MAG: sensor histidine kinase [Beutenbergiaceae bacterium]